MPCQQVHDLYDAYLRPLADTPDMRAVIETGARVKAISRQGIGKVVTRGREDRPFSLVGAEWRNACRVCASDCRCVRHLAEPEPAWRFGPPGHRRGCRSRSD